MALLRVESRVSFRSEDVDVDVGVTLTLGGGAWTRRLRRRPDRREALWAEMAAYTTPADRLDMEAILDRYADDDTAEIRSILADQAAHSDR